jgi:hypothetical protein
MFSHVDVVNLLLQHRAALNSTNGNGETPLHICCTTNLGTPKDRLEVATLLLSEKKINITAVDSRGREPLSCTKSIQLCNLIKNALQVAPRHLECMCYVLVLQGPSLQFLINSGIGFRGGDQKGQKC